MTDISQDKLIEYVLGECDETECLMIEREIHSSTTLQRLLADLKDSFALPGLASDPLEPDPGLGKRLLESIEDQFSFAGFIDRLSVFLNLPKLKVQKLLASIAHCEQDWLSSPIRGLRERPVEAGPRHVGAKCTMFRLEPGAIFSHHSHAGDEWGFILRGEALEDNGKVYKPGDMVYKTPSSHHAIAAGDAEALLLIVIHRGIAFTQA